MIEAFLEFASELDPSYPDRVVGASHELVERLEDLVGTWLPASYREYLLRLGERDGLEAFADASPRIDAVTDYYEEAARPGSGLKLPPNAVVIAVGGCAVEQVSLVWGHAHGEPEVMLTDGDHVGHFHAQSLEKLLWRAAWTMLSRERRFGGWAAVQATLGEATASGIRLEDVARSAEAAGFSKLWFSDRATFLGQRDDGAAISIYQFEDRSGLWLGVAAGDAVEARRLAAPIAERHGLGHRETGDVGPKKA